MDSSRGRHQHYLKSCKPSTFHYNHQHENNYNMPSNCGIFKTSKIQRHSLIWKKDHYTKGNHRFRLPYRKTDVGGRKAFKSAEDVEEEERKKKLTDTAKHLLSKIKTWNAEKSDSEDVSQQNCSVNPVVSESSFKHNEEKVSSKDKPRRIAHSKKAKMVKNRTSKSFSQPARMTSRYEVNKDTVKNFQNRIQHKLIEEIMQMPKENLQNVLNDPKINPVMELKMSRLVRENKLLIAQKLRALAESKMKSSGSSTNPQLLLDFDKLIDPVIETDLSVLPFELIKQMENAFQVQFDYTSNIADSEVESSVGESVTDNIIVGENEMPLECEKNIKVELKEDVSMYECTTDEDEEVDYSRSTESEEVSSSAKQDKMEEATEGTDVTTPKRQKLSTDFEKVVDSVFGFQNASGYKPQEHDEHEIPLKNSFTSKVSVASQCIFEELLKNSLKEFTSTGCQTDCSFVSVQTAAHCSGVGTLYGVPLPKEATDESFSSLLEEVNSVQNLTNKLNERRLMIFLQLAKMAPSGSFTSDNFTQKNFVETVANGSLCLVESLRQFFENHQRHTLKHKKRKFPERNANKTRSGNDGKEGQENRSSQ